MRSQRINLRGTASRNVDAAAQVKKPGDCAIVHRGSARSIVMLCPEGCGTVLTINLDRRTGKAWRMYRRDQRISVFPSYWRDDGCECHFIIWQNRILWCDLRSRFETPDVSRLHEKVLDQLPTDSFETYESIADRIDEIPWDVLWACRALVREGHAMENKQQEAFKKKKAGGDGQSKRRTVAPGHVSFFA